MMFRLTLVLLAFTATASAGIFPLNQDTCPGTCGLGVYGTVVVTQTSTLVVTITEQLASGNSFEDGAALAFNVSGPITIGDLSAGFQAGTTPAAAGTFGTAYSIVCSDCQNANLLSFTVSSSAGINVEDFTTNPDGYAFSSYIQTANGNTGFVASDGALKALLPTTNGFALPTVPEPATLTLFGVALISLGLLRRRRKR